MVSTETSHSEKARVAKFVPKSPVAKKCSVDRPIRTALPVSGSAWTHNQNQFMYLNPDLFSLSREKYKLKSTANVEAYTNVLTEITNRGCSRENLS